MGTPHSVERSPDPLWGGEPRAAQADVIRIGEAQEEPSQATLPQRPEAAEDALVARIEPMLRALDRGAERARRESEAEARRIVAAARDEAARIRKSIEDELVTAHLGLDQLRARRDEVIQQLRTLYDLVVAMSNRLPTDDAPVRAERSAGNGLPPPPPDPA